MICTSAHDRSEIDMLSPTLNTPLVVGPDDGEAIWFGPNRMTIKATAADTAGAFGLTHAWVRAGTGPPLHVHHDADESFWILEGTLRIRCGDAEFAAVPGTFTFLPRGVPHAFLAEPGTDVRMLNILSPGGSERFFADAGEPAGGPGLPPPALPDVPRLGRVGAAYNVEVLGPPMRIA
jgi:mannose-6-phosphate isomerase-like protein (cupin superfamily)